MPLTTAEANASLPQQATIEAPDPAKLNYLVIAPPKFGKTTFLCSIPDALLMAFEQGHAFQRAYKLVIDSWDKKVTEENPAVWQEEESADGTPGLIHATMVKAVEILEASDRFSFVIIDTVDMAAKMCLDYFLKKYGWAHAKEGGDYGVGHDIAQNTPFRQMVGRIMRTGRGVGFITHSEVKKNELQAKKETTLPNGVYKFLHTQADIIMHGTFGIKRKGYRYRDRVFQIEGDEETLAGNRVRNLQLPAKYVVDPEDPWSQWTTFFVDSTAVASAEEDLRQASLLKDTGETDVQETLTPEVPADAPAEPKPTRRKGK